MTDEPGKVDLATPDLAAAKRAAFDDLFPGVLADGVLDAARLGELLDTDVTAPADGRERFGLMWAGKQDAVRSLLAQSRGALIPESDKSIDFDSASNVFIEGDNLEALKLLQKAYNDKVKLIYIDPPYNTGSNDFIYPDDFSDTLRAYLEFTGQVDSHGNRTSTNADTMGRRHSRWASMMYPRLILARNLLTQDGVIFVSIDDNEVANLRLVMDEVFGAENFIATVIWHGMDSPKNSARYFSEDHEYLLLYARNAACWRPNLLPRTEEMVARYKNPDKDPRGPWLLGDLAARNPYSEGTYAITTPSGRTIAGPPPGSYWRISKAKFDELDADGRIWWGDGSVRPGVKRFLSEVRDGVIPQTYWNWRDVGSTRHSKRELLRRVQFGSSASVFDTPKPVSLIRRMITLSTGPNDGDIILDFFAGSGTTADAVMQQNEDGGNRRFICVQLPEPTGFDDFPLVSDITRARIDAAMKDVAPTIGLRSFRLGASSFYDETTADPESLFDLRESTLGGVDQSMEAIAAEVLLKEGVPLDAAWLRHAAGGAPVVMAEGVAVVMTLKINEVVATEALELKPRVLVFLEDGFAGRDAVKANVFTNAKNLGITMKTV